MPQKCSLFHVIIIYFRIKTCTLIEDSFGQFMWHYQIMSGLRLFQYTKFCFSILRQISIFSKSASDCARSTRWMQSYYLELLANSLQRASSWLWLLLKVQHTNLKIPHGSVRVRCQSSKPQIQSLTCINSLYFFWGGVCVWTVITAIWSEKSKK